MTAADEQARAAVLGWQRTVLAADQSLRQSLGSATAQLPAADAGGAATAPGQAGAIGLGLAGIVVGGTVAALGAGLEVAGVALDATGIGAVLGVPANVAGVGVMAFGGTMAGAGAMELAQATTGTDPAQPMQVNARGFGGGAKGAAAAAAKQVENAEDQRLHDKVESQNGEIKREDMKNMRPLLGWGKKK